MSQHESFRETNFPLLFSLFLTDIDDFLTSKGVRGFSIDGYTILM